MSIQLVIAVMVGFTLLGVLLRVRGGVSAAVAARLNAIALNFTLPAGIFLALHRFSISREALVPSALFACLTFLWWGLAEAVARALRLPPSQRAVFALTIIFGNTAFIGFPVIEAILGETAKARAVLIDQIGAEPLAFTLGAFIAGKGAHESLAIPWREEVKRILLFPPLLAMVAGIAWQFLGGPEVSPMLATGLKSLSNLTVPLVMVALGLLIRAGSLRRSWRLASLVSVLRLAVAPLSALLAARAMALPSEAVTVATLEAGMPSMMFNLVLALRYRLDAELCAAFITATLIGSLVTLPAWFVLLR